MHLINLGIEQYKNAFWSQLFKVINMNYQIDWVEYQNKIYFNCSNQWNKADEIIQKIRQHGKLPCHKDYPCDGYGECYGEYNEEYDEECDEECVDECDEECDEECVECMECMECKYNKINIENMDNFQYIFSGSIDSDDLEMWVEDDEDDEDNEKQDNQDNQDNQHDYKNDKGICNIILQMENLNLPPDQIKFITEKDIVITNNCGINEDHRGSNHTILKLPFETKVNLGKEFTFYDLLTANSNLKAHKFDYNY